MGAIACGVVALLAQGVAAHAATRCALPMSFGLSVEQREVAERVRPELVVTDAASNGSARIGDVIRQANGARVTACADLARVAQAALASGLALLLDVERDGTALAVAARAQPSTANGATPSPPQVALAPAGDGAPPPAAREPDSAAADVPAPPPVASRPVAQARKPATLPPGSEASADLRRAAGAASRVLAEMDATAKLSVPLVLYERRLGDVETAVEELPFGDGRAGSDVHDAVQEILDYHRTARDVRRTKLQILSQRGMDYRATANALPYFSNSKVTEWVATYPFLDASLIEAPRKTRMLSGEVAGRWDPDRALELLWERARKANERLAEWAR